MLIFGWITFTLRTLGVAGYVTVTLDPGGRSAPNSTAPGLEEEGGERKVQEDPSVVVADPPVVAVTTQVKAEGATATISCPISSAATTDTAQCRCRFCTVTDTAAVPAWEG